MSELQIEYMCCSMSCVLDTLTPSCGHLWTGSVCSPVRFFSLFFCVVECCSGRVGVGEREKWEKKKKSNTAFRKDLEQAEVFQSAVRAACLAALRAKSLMLTLFLKPRPRFDEISLRRSCKITSLHVHTWAERPPRCIFPLRQFKCSPASFWGFFFSSQKSHTPTAKPALQDRRCTPWLVGVDTS